MEINWGEVTFLILVGIVTIRMDVVLSHIDHHLLMLIESRKANGPVMPTERPRTIRRKRLYQAHPKARMNRLGIVKRIARSTIFLLAEARFGHPQKHLA